jgi:hypothetical protein
MKKLLIATNVLTLILFYMSSFTGAKKTDTITGSKDCDNIVMSYNTNTINGISFATAQTMSILYANRIAKYNVAFYKDPLYKANYDHSKSVWFSLERLKSFIWEIESTMCNANCGGKNGKSDSLGVRIYFGSYPANLSSSPDYSVLPSNYAKYNSIFMVPTFYDTKNKGNIDFDPRNMGLDACNPIPLCTYTGKCSKTNATNNGGGGVKSFNNFMIPPPTGASLILTANESQFFKGDSVKVNNVNLKPGAGRGGPVNLLFPYAVQSLMNHGTIIPPEKGNDMPAF